MMVCVTCCPGQETEAFERRGFSMKFLVGNATHLGCVTLVLAAVLNCLALVFGAA
jgi:hypothetical protein